MSNFNHQPAHHPQPTDRELDVLRLLADGLDHEAIGKRLFISPETSKSRPKTARAKLHAPNGTAAVYQAVKNHWLD